MIPDKEMLSAEMRTLRLQAEKIAQASGNDPHAPLRHEEMRAALHELRVHQIELEMQNEELRRLQRELETSRTRYFDLYDQAPAGYFTISEAGLILEANLTGASLLGVDRNHLIKHPYTRFIFKDDQDHYYLHRKRLFETGEPQACEVRLIKNDGTTCWAHLDAAIAQDISGERVSRVIVSNISTRKLAEDGLRRTQDALEIANRELKQSLARQQLLAHTDDVTSLYNRRYFFELARREFDAAVRYSRPLTVLMFDVDGFKQINDIYGHMTGDKVLAWIAQEAVTHIRAVDVLARYGGDEFILLLPETSAEHALPMAERFRANVAARSDPPGVTISVGIAELSREPVDSGIDLIVQRADRAMYMAKARGRNCTMVFPENEV